ncbi:MAG: nucleotidyltransferase domain-containing protein [Asgard group archaeon]|nr:nucleotidyltransferase domain-containing protein [Asgard group archaeon]
MEDPKVREKYDVALEFFVERAKQDTQVLGIILFGSLAHNRVHERSNINIMVVTKEGNTGYKRVVENGIPFDIGIYNINAFRRNIFGRRRVAYHQSLSRSRLLFSRDNSIDDLYKNISESISGQDQTINRVIYHGATHYDLYKAEKFLFIKDEPEYAMWFLVHALSEMGYLMCYMNGIFPPREVILQAKKLYPDFYTPLYENLLNSTASKEIIEYTIREAYRFLDEHALKNFELLLNFISDNDGTATEKELNTYAQDKGLYFMDMDYLQRRRIIRRTYAPVKLTKKGRIEYHMPQYHFSWDSFDPKDVVPSQIGPSNVDRSLVVKDYQDAFDSLLEKVKQDEYMLSIMVYGSLAYDKVWEKSDIGAILITRDDVYRRHHVLVEKDVSINAQLHTRDDFRKFVQRVTDGSIPQSLLSKSKVVYTNDETIYDIYEDIQKMGSRDLENILLANYVYCRDLLNKALRALNVNEDPTFSFSFIISSMRRLANIEVILDKQIPIRESIIQALEINPEFFNEIYKEAVRNPTKDKESLNILIRKIEKYLDERLEKIAQPIIRLVEKYQEAPYDLIWKYLNEIRIPIDLSDFVKKDFLDVIETPVRFVRKSSSDMNQPTYILADSTEDIMMDFDV